MTLRTTVWCYIYLDKSTKPFQLISSFPVCLNKSFFWFHMCLLMYFHDVWCPIHFCAGSLSSLIRFVHFLPKKKKIKTWVVLMCAYPSLHPLALYVKKIPLTYHNITFLCSVHTEDLVREGKKYFIRIWNHSNWSWPRCSRWAESSAVRLNSKFMSYLGKSGSEVSASSLSLSSKTQVVAACRGKRCRIILHTA